LGNRDYTFIACFFEKSIYNIEDIYYRKCIILKNYERVNKFLKKDKN